MAFPPQFLIPFFSNLPDRMAPARIVSRRKAVLASTDSDPRIHYQHSQAYPQTGHTNPKFAIMETSFQICTMIDRYQAPQTCLHQRNKECSVSYPSENKDEQSPLCTLVICVRITKKIYNVRWVGTPLIPPCGAQAGRSL